MRAATCPAASELRGGSRRLERNQGESGEGDAARRGTGRRHVGWLAGAKNPGNDTVTAGLNVCWANQAGLAGVAMGSWPGFRLACQRHRRTQLLPLTQKTKKSSWE